jgi:hypothetical protein
VRHLSGRTLRLIALAVGLAAFAVGSAVLGAGSPGGASAAGAPAAPAPDATPALTALADAALGARSPQGVAVTVGAQGNEPLVAAAPDGTLIISALQHIYRSTDGGATWTKLPGPPEAGQLNLNSDSSIAFDPGGRLYFTFDYPYAGTTAVCTSDDHGDTWTCNPAVVPGGTDRMWVVAPSSSDAYEVTNEGLYQTTFLQSHDGGLTWVPSGFGNALLEPQTGPLFRLCGSRYVIQPLKVFDAGRVEVYVFDPSVPTAVQATKRPSPLPLPNALVGATLTLDGQKLWVVSEAPNASGGRAVVLANSSDEGATWTSLPPIPQTATGTATFTWVAAGSPGHVGVLYYDTPTNGDPTTLAGATWSVKWAETSNATDVTPTWTVTTLEENVHVGPICAAANCSGTNRFAGDFIHAIFDSHDVAHLSWMKQENGTGPISIRYQKIPEGPKQTNTQPCGATAAAVAISGRIVTRFGVGVAGVRVRLEGGAQARAISAQTVTRSDGSFRFRGVRVGGVYTVTPKRSGYSFLPAGRSFSLVGGKTVRFVAQRR